MKAVDRGKFCKYNAYMDSPQGIGYSVTISAPHMVIYHDFPLPNVSLIIVIKRHVFIPDSICHFHYGLFQHAHALEILSNHMKEGGRALDIGSGTGYLTACMGIMVIFYYNEFVLFLKIMFNNNNPCYTCVLNYCFWVKTQDIYDKPST